VACGVGTPKTKNMKTTVDALMSQAFDCHRTPRSQPYMDGASAALMFKLCGVALRNPFAQATANADAWWAGLDEGKQLARQYLAGLTS
jgi:hypothetical protein